MVYLMVYAFVDVLGNKENLFRRDPNEDMIS